jgi:mannosyltransferase OCH1-like enzyme
VEKMETKEQGNQAEVKQTKVEVEKTTIIRKIHQIWVQGSEHFKKAQPEFYSFSQKWSQLYPTFEHKVWSEEDYLPLIRAYSSELEDVYHACPTFAAKSDIARYVILAAEGGLYADTDYEAFKNCEYLLRDVDLVIVAMHLTKNKLLFANFQYNTAWMYSVPNHPLFHLLLKTIATTKFNPKQYSVYDYVFNVTGPRAFGSAIQELQLTTDPKTRILPHSLIELADFSTVGITQFNEAHILLEYPFAVGMHRCDGSWIKNIGTVKQLFGSVYTWLTNWSEMVHIVTVVMVIVFLTLSCVALWKFKHKKCSPA